LITKHIKDLKLEEKSIRRKKIHESIKLGKFSAIGSAALLFTLAYIFQVETLIEPVATWATGTEVVNGLNRPTDVAIDDSSGNVYVADTGNSRIQIFSSNGTYITSWGGEGSGTGQFSYPAGLDTDNSSNVYVADTRNNRMQKFSSNGTYITSWGRDGSDKGQFKYPSDLAIDPISGNVYVADTDNHRIQIFSPSGTYMGSWGGEIGTENGQFVSPGGLAIDLAGNVYVADTGNNRIQILSSNGTYIGSW
jgi:DNA-binding beta-propeller fold protein YncE